MVGVCYMELMLFESSSLKDKRQVLKTVKTRSRQKFNISICEADHQQSWKRIALEIATAAGDKTGAEKVLQEVIRFIESDGRLEILNHYIEYI